MIYTGKCVLGQDHTHQYLCACDPVSVSDGRFTSIDLIVTKQVVPDACEYPVLHVWMDMVIYSTVGPLHRSTHGQMHVTLVRSPLTQVSLDY